MLGFPNPDQALIASICSYRAHSPSTQDCRSACVVNDVQYGQFYMKALQRDIHRSRQPDQANIVYVLIRRRVTLMLYKLLCGNDARARV